MLEPVPSPRARSPHPPISSIKSDPMQPHVMFYNPRSAPPTLARPRHPLYPLEDETRPFDSVQNLPCNLPERDGRIGMCEVSRNVCTLISIPCAPTTHSLPVDRALLRNANANVRYHSISYTRAPKVNDIR